MKKNAIIVLFLISALIGAFSLKSTAQTQNVTITVDRKSDTAEWTLLADETTLTETKTGAKIECSNDQVHFKIYEKWQHTFVRYSWSWKKDRHGPYKQYSITVSRKDAELIKEWAKTNL